MTRIFLVLLSFFFFILPLFAQSVDTAWVRRYNGTRNSVDMPRAITTDDSGNVYVTGVTNYGSNLGDYATIKYFPNGDTAWLRIYNGPSYLHDDARGNAGG